MIEWKRGVVLKITEPSNVDEGSIQELEVQLEDTGSTAKAIHYTDNFRMVEAGDRVLLNTTAHSLQLGTGGFHFVHSILSGEKQTELDEANPSSSGNNTSTSRSQGLSSFKSNERTKQDGHIMKLRYTSLQRPVLAAEEPGSPYHELFRDAVQSLNNMPVLVGELHSMLPAAVCCLRLLEQRHPRSKPLRAAYIMSDGGALPLSFSKHAAELRKLGWLAGTITYGHAYGGDIEAVNKYTALLAARLILQADIAIVTMGPGSVGTGTTYGFSGMEVGEIINAAASLKGRPFIIPRISFADQRDRHFGISHHTLTILRDIVQSNIVVALPVLDGKKGDQLRLQICEAGLHEKHNIDWVNEDISIFQKAALQAYTLPITSMGRELHSDPAFFAGIAAAAVLAWKSLS